MLKEWLTGYNEYDTETLLHVMESVRCRLDADYKEEAVITWLHSEALGDGSVRHYLSVFVEDQGQTGATIHARDLELAEDRLGKKIDTEWAASLRRPTSIYNGSVNETETRLSTEVETPVEELTEALNVQYEILRTLKRIDASLDKNVMEGDVGRILKEEINDW